VELRSRGEIGGEALEHICRLTLEVKRWCIDVWVIMEMKRWTLGVEVEVP
jgi:hypothetical protein